MRNIGLLAFGITSLLIVPAALHRLTAGPKQVAKLVAAGADSLELKGAKIEVSVDRSILDPGDKVKVKLVASADSPRKVGVGLLVLESMGTYNGRVPEPPLAIAIDSFTLEAKPGGGAAHEVEVRLPGKRNSREMDFGTYQILVASPSAITKLEKLRARARTEGVQPGWDPMESPSPHHEKYMTAYYELRNPEQAASDSDGEPEAGALGTSALVTVNTRPTDSPIAIQAPEQVAPGEPFTVTVTVKNPTKRAIHELAVELAQPNGLSGDYLGLAPEEITIEPADATVSLAPHQRAQVQFRVTPKRAGVLGLYASTRCGEECDYDARLTASALDAVDVVGPAKPADPKPAPITTAKR